MEANSQLPTSTTLSTVSAARALVNEFRSNPEAVAASKARRQRAARRLKEHLSQVPFYAERAKNNPDYWLDLAASAVNY